MKLLKSENPPVDLFGNLHVLAVDYLYDKLGIRYSDSYKGALLNIIDRNLAGFFEYLEQEIFKDVRIKIRVVLFDVSEDLFTRGTVYSYVSGRDSRDVPDTFGYQYFSWNHRNILLTTRI